MNPEIRQLQNEVRELKKLLNSLHRVENVSFIESLRRRLLGSVDDLPDIKLSDLTDVSGTDTASTGEVLKKTATTWQPGVDIDT